MENKCRFEGRKDARLRGMAYETMDKYTDMWLGKLGATENHITLKPGTGPEHQMLYRQGPELRAVVLSHIAE